MLPIDPDVLAKLPSDSLAMLSAVPEEAKKTGVITPKFLDDLHCYYELLSLDSEIPKDLQVRFLLAVYRLVDENMAFRKENDKHVADLITQHIKANVPTFRFG
jgi:hypothetical protein